MSLFETDLSPEAIQKLLDQGADPNALGPEKMYPLHYANAAGTKTLLDHEADPNCCDEHGETPFFKAVRNKDIERVRALLDGGARTEYSGRSRLLGRKKTDTALDLAVYENRSDIVKLILANGTVLDDATNLFYIRYAISKRNTDMLKLFICKEMVNVYGESLLQLWIKHPDLAVLDVLLEYGADKIIKNSGIDFAKWAQSHSTPVMNAVFLKHDIEIQFYAGQLIALVSNMDYELALEVVSHGEDITVRGASGHSVMYTLFQNEGFMNYPCGLPLFRALINCGSDVNEIVEHGVPILHKILSEPETVELMISKKVNICATDADGLTALHYAVMQNKVRSAELLIEAGADKFTKAKDLTTPAHYATSEEMKALFWDTKKK